MHFLSLTHFNVTVPTLCVDSKGVGKGLSGQGGDVAGSALLALETLVFLCCWVCCWILHRNYKFERILVCNLSLCYVIRVLKHYIIIFGLFQAPRRGDWTFRDSCSGGRSYVFSFKAVLSDASSDSHLLLVQL